MPELPEVETVKRGLQPAMEGARIIELRLNRKDLRFTFPQNFAARLKHRQIISLSRRAKYLLADIDSGEVLIMHLGMSGSFRVEAADDMAASSAMPGNFFHPKSAAQKHDHVIFKLETPQGRVNVIYNDPRRFGYMDLIAREGLETHKLFCGLGIEPTGNALNGKTLAAMFENKKAPLKAALLDQRLIAGLGNIYVCEALWRAGLSPKRVAATIARKGGGETVKSGNLAHHIRAVIAEAIKAGGSSLRDHRQTDGELGYFQHNFAVYGRENQPCLNKHCAKPVRRIVQSGRSTFYCPACQQ